MIAVVALVFATAFHPATAFPSPSKTAWMRPESFHLAIGMPRADALKAVRIFKPKTTDEEAMFDFSDSRAVTLQFRRDRLHAIRFELFGFLHEARAAFDEEKAWLQTTFGPPKRGTQAKSILLYDDRLPNVMAVLSADPNSEQGRKGLGMVVVRYSDPASRYRPSSALRAPSPRKRGEGNSMRAGIDCPRPV
jgi:hypothetical protein